MKKFFSKQLIIAIIFSVVMLAGYVVINNLYLIKPQTYNFLFMDDNEMADLFGRHYYMGMYENGRDGSVEVVLKDTTQAKFGNESMRFSYTPTQSRHWAGFMLNFPQDGVYDVSEHSAISFYVKGTGGSVLFYAEDSGGNKIEHTVPLSNNWREVTLNINDWDNVKIPFGWSCNQNNPDTTGGTINFWVDGVSFVKK